MSKNIYGVNAFVSKDKLKHFGHLVVGVIFFNLIYAYFKCVLTKISLYGKFRDNLILI